MLTTPTTILCFLLLVSEGPAHAGKKIDALRLIAVIDIMLAVQEVVELEEGGEPAVEVIFHS